MPKLPKITSLLFPYNILRKKWVVKLTFCKQIRMKVSYIDTKILMGMVSISKAHKIASLQLEMKLIFCTQIYIKISHKFISTFWTSYFPARWYYHYWWTWTNILKVLKVTTLQYLYNISKKEVKDGVHFLHAEKT